MQRDSMQRANEINKVQTVLLGGNRDNGANAGSRCSNWNNYVWNSNWNIGSRFACEDSIRICTHQSLRAWWCDLKNIMVSLFVLRRVNTLRGL